MLQGRHLVARRNQTGDHLRRDKLPNTDKAFVEPANLPDYLLSQARPEGKAKSNVFLRFGFARSQFDLLEASLMQHAVLQPVIEVKAKHGVKYTLACAVRSPDGRNPCIWSVWIVDVGEGSPSLVTACPGARA